jgi:basic membrane protein A
MKAMLTLAATAVIGFSASAMAADFAPAVVYDTTGKFDKSFNEAVFRNGVEKFAAESGVRVREFEPQNEEQREQGLRRLASRGQSPIVAVGFAFGTAVSKVAAEFPDIQFAIIDMPVNLPNVQSLLFAEHEGSFLAGALAAMKSETGAAGYIGGMDVPLIRKFECGYEQGFKYVKPDGQVFKNMIGSTGAAFNDPAKASEIAKTQISRGADVLFAAAGGSGVGVYQAAKDEGVYAIGVDSNQNYLFPGTMLTSMIKKVGLASYDTWSDAQDGEWVGGIKNFDLAAGGVDLAFDQYNEPLVTAEMKSSIEQIKADIISGKIAVHDYMTTDSCDY